MNDGPSAEDSPAPSGTGGPEGRSAGPTSSHAEKAPVETSSRRRAWKARADRILPPRPPGPEDRLTSPLPGIVLFLFLLGVAALSILLLRPPGPLPASAPTDQFSAARALHHVQALAARPHPPGTAAHAEAQAYLVAQLKRLGLEPQVQKAVAVRRQSVATVENVLARLPGSEGGGKAILLDAHYDSVATGPGATDNALAVGALLETARALKASGRPLANDVIFFFSDGEEIDLMGAQAFVDEHPWAKEVGLVLDLEARGRGGPVYTFQTSPGNNWLISQYAESAPYPLASSLMYEIYRRLPNDTDLTVYKDAGYAGLDFAAIGDSAYYHTALDDADHIDLGSLQHHGSYALSLVRRFGGLDLTAAHTEDAVYFNALGTSLFVHYPRAWVFPLVVVAALVCVGALVFGLRWKQVSPRGVFMGALASLLVVAVLAGVGYLLWRLVVVVYPRYEMGGMGGDIYNSLYYWLAFMALGMGLAALLHSGLRTRIRAAELASGAMLLWLASAVGVSVSLPGVSFVLTWPLLSSGLGLWGWFALRRFGSARIWGIAVLALSAVPVVLLVVPLTYQVYAAMTIQKIWIPVAVLALLVGLLAPHLAIIARPRKWWLPVLMGIVAVGFLVAGHLTSAYTPERPRQDGVVYALSADNGKASWLGWTGLDVWTEQFFGKDAGGGDYRDIFPGDYSVADYKTAAPLVDLPAPTVEELDATVPGVFHLRVAPPPGAWTVHLVALPYETPVTYFVDDRPIEAKDGWLVYWAPPAEGFDLTVKAPALDSLKLRVVAHTLGLPAIPGFTYAARPDWIIPISDSGDNSTWVAKTFSFGKRQALGTAHGSSPRCAPGRNGWPGPGIAYLFGFFGGSSATWARAAATQALAAASSKAAGSVR
jgi:Peptidase family M28